jgi:hypothetical protein
MRNVGVFTAASSRWSGSAPVSLAADWNRSKTTVIAFAQDHSSREILGAAVSLP